VVREEEKLAPEGGAGRDDRPAQRQTMSPGKSSKDRSACEGSLLGKARAKSGPVACPVDDHGLSRLGARRDKDYAHRGARVRGGAPDPEL